MRIKSITVSGYRSFASEAPCEMSLGDVTVMIGMNGAGKSNIVSVFRLLQEYPDWNGVLKELSRQDGASQFYMGPKRTPSAQIDFRVESDDGRGMDRAIGFSFIAPAGISQTFPLPNSDWGEAFLRRIRVFQFNDTSLTSNVRLPVYVGNSEMLLSDAANLAAILKRIKEMPEWRMYYKRIVGYIAAVFPGFGDFRLIEDPVKHSVMLNWCDCDNSDYVYGPHQLSDGTLRFMALATLLLSPPELLPSVIVIDEPELGLHPSAIGALAAMMKIASSSAQVVVATQSPRLLDEFDPSQILVVDRDSATKSTVCHSLDESALVEWLQDYALSDLWEKNLMGGNP